MSPPSATAQPSDDVRTWMALNLSEPVSVNSLQLVPFQRRILPLRPTAQPSEDETMLMPRRSCEVGDVEVRQPTVLVSWMPAASPDPTTAAWVPVPEAKSADDVCVRVEPMLVVAIHCGEAASWILAGSPVPERTVLANVPGEK